MTITREQVIEMAKDADEGFGNDDGDMPNSIIGFNAVERLANLDFSAGRDAGLGDAAEVCNKSGHLWSGATCRALFDAADAITALKGKQ